MVRIEAQELLDAAPYDRNTVEVLQQALADAWASIALTTGPDLAQTPG
jgi:hypothetical protein